MKYFIIIVTFFFFFRSAFPVLDYVVNYDYISKELCENKAKPELKCNGKCHLKAELAKAAEKNTPDSQDSKRSFTFEVLFLETLPAYSFRPIFVVKESVSNFYSSLYCRLHSNRIFDPPTI